MPILIHNTLTRRKEPFQPIDPTNVRVYVCGPTVYDLAHIGNARPVVVFDTLFRLLRHVYGEPHVTYVRNITDVDDKIIAAAAANGEPIEALTNRTAAAYHEDMAALHALAPTAEPRATEHIGAMVAMIGTLIEREVAYAADGHVLFHVPAMPDYGQLSGRSLDEMIAGARVEVAPYKKHPADFVLWKPAKPGEPGWDSPWGRGRPGWHIECSAMGEALLGRTFDIHGGGIDLIFPHHENEIAQSRSAHDGAPLARYWMHNGFVQVSGEKMSKSLGNFFTVRELLAEGHRGEAIRLALLSAHYRQPLDITRERLKEARATLDRWYRALALCGQSENYHYPPDTDLGVMPVLDALKDDLNTPLAVVEMNRQVDFVFNLASTDASVKRKIDFAELGGRLSLLGSWLGLLTENPDKWFRGEVALEVHGLTMEIGLGQVTVVTMSDTEIDDRVVRREAARKSKNFADADRIREELSNAGIILEDSPDGRTKWRRA